MTFGLGHSDTPENLKNYGGQEIRSYRSSTTYDIVAHRPHQPQCHKI